MTGPVRRVEDAEGRGGAAALALCERLLAVRPRTTAQLRRALESRAFAAQIVEAALTAVERQHLVDDRLYAQAWVDSRHSGRGLARRALARELAREGVPAEESSAALARIGDEDEAAMGRSLVRRRLPSVAGLPPVAQARRLSGLLARRGYPPDLAARIVREALQDAGRDGPGADVERGMLDLADTDVADR